MGELVSGFGTQEQHPSCGFDLNAGYKISIDKRLDVAIVFIYRIEWHAFVQQCYNVCLHNNLTISPNNAKQLLVNAYDDENQKELMNV